MYHQKPLSISRYGTPAHSAQILVMKRKVVKVQPRTKALWTKDPKVKEAKQHSKESSQFAVNSIIDLFLSHLNHMRSNIRLTVGRTHL